MAAEKGMSELSFRAVREVLRAGPPVKAQPVNQQFGTSAARRVRSINPNRVPDDSATIYPQVARKLTAIVALWNKSGISAEEQYQALAGVVFPEGRPGEIFLYPLPLAPKTPGAQQSVGRLLAAKRSESRARRRPQVAD